MNLSEKEARRIIYGRIHLSARQGMGKFLTGLFLLGIVSIMVSIIEAIFYGLNSAPGMFFIPFALLLWGFVLLLPGLSKFEKTKNRMIEEELAEWRTTGSLSLEQSHSGDDNNGKDTPNSSRADSEHKEPLK